MKYITIGKKRISVTDKQADAIARQIFMQQKIDDVENALDRMGIEATPLQVEEIADSLYYEIFEHDEEYWELEDKNILYLAGKMGIA